MRTLFLNPPSYEDFDGGAGSRYQAKREVWSFWYPTWLAYPAGMLPGARLLDAPPLDLSVEETVRIARDYAHVVVHTSTPAFRADVRTAQAIKDAKPDAVIGFVGGHVTAMPDESLRYAPVIDYVARKEFDLAVVGVAEGRRFADVKGLSFRQNGSVVHNEESAPLTTEQLDALPFVTEVYARDLDYLRYNSPYCQYPYVSLYTGLPRARHPDPRDVHPGAAGRDAGDDRGDDPLRAGDEPRDPAGVARLAVPGHGVLRVRDEERLPHGRQPGRRDRLPEVHRLLSGGFRRRDIQGGGAVLPPLLLPAAAHPDGGPADGVEP